MKPIQKVLKHFKGVRENGSGHVARCSAHDDSSPSLSIGENAAGAVLLNCHAGCDTEAILDAAGLEWADLYPDDYEGDGAATRSKAAPAVPRPQPPQETPEPEVEGVAREEVEAWSTALLDSEKDAHRRAREYLVEERRIDPELLRSRRVGLRFDKGLPWIVFPLDVEGGRVTLRKERAFDPAAMDWKRDDGGKPFVRTKGGGSTLAIMGTDRGGALLLCEGETDAFAARSNGWNVAFGSAGAGTFRKDWAKQIAALDVSSVAVCYDGDDAGRENGPKVARQLDAEGASVRVAELPDGTDVNDVLREHGNERLREIVGNADSFFSNPTYKRKERKSDADALFQTAAEITRRGLPETSWLVPSLLPEAALVLLTGAAKSSGKTTFATHFSRALLRGGPFLGSAAVQSPVVYLTEQAERSLHNEYLTPAGIESAEDLHLLHGYRAASLTWEEIVEAAVRRATGVGARLLVVDTFMHFAGLTGDSENNSGAVQHALRPLQHAAAEHGLTVVVVHHDRKAGGDVFTSGRGSSAFQGVVDLILNLRRPTGNHPANLRELRTAGRFSDVPGELMIELDGGPGGVYRSLGSGPDVAARKARQILKEVLPRAEADAERQDALLEAARSEGADVSNSTIHRALKRLVDEGEAREVGDGVKGDPYRYFRFLPEPPPNER